MLIIPASSRFLPLARRAVGTLVHESHLAPEEIYELQLAVMEACNLVNGVHAGRARDKVISITAVLNGEAAHITIDDGDGHGAGRKARQQLSRRLPIEGDLALKTAQELCDTVNLSTGMTGGLRIELTKRLKGSWAPSRGDDDENAQLI